jgi:hypothetical protein
MLLSLCHAVKLIPSNDNPMSVEMDFFTFYRLNQSYLMIIFKLIIGIITFFENLYFGGIAFECHSLLP